MAKLEVRSIGGLPLTTVQKMDQYLNIFLFGESGVGKTVFLGSVSEITEMSPALILDIEGGTLSLSDFFPNVDVVRISTWRELVRVYEALESGSTEYKTVGIDSLSEAQKLSMEYIMTAAVKEDRDIDRDVPQMRHWGKNLEQTRRLVRGFRDLPMHCIFTSLASIDKDNRGRTTYRPMLTGKLAGEIPGFVDIVMYMYIKEHGDQLKRLLVTRKTDAILAKDRSNKLPPIVELDDGTPGMKAIFDYIYNGKGEQ